MSKLTSLKISKPRIIYTDGSCCPNPGKGGWGAIIVYDDFDYYLSGKAERTTNNMMELTAVIEALKACTEKDVTIYSDSKYVIECAKGNWQRKKNTELWKYYDSVAKNKNIKWNWVKGHNGDYYNELVDKLAKSEI
jgi:ribonuclease HI